MSTEITEVHHSWRIQRSYHLPLLEREPQEERFRMVPPYPSHKNLMVADVVKKIKKKKKKGENGGW